MLRYDLRSAPGIGAPHDKLYPAVLEQSAWADRHGCDGFLFAEHHESPDGYLPSPAALAAAVAARTAHGRLLIVQTPLRDPFAMAEDIAVVDNISSGRVELLLTMGYVPAEFAFYGEQFAHRVGTFLEKSAVLLSLLAGERVHYRGRGGTVTPRPVQRPRPPVRFGGATPASARRAARMADAYMPMIPDPQLLEIYRDECARLGGTPLAYPFPGAGLSVIVTEDPERTWAVVAPCLRHDANSYARWRSAEPTASPYQTLSSDSEIRNSGLHSVVTPDECVSLARQVPAPASLLLHPLAGGVPPDVGWQSLHLFVDKVLPPLASGSPQ
ncbi:MULTISPECIES: LLM class flavin-dependent oxidoreductase [Amycolatopsis]|nr:MULTISPECIES: LLM class flavin-dependent oxidoreductase [Amycolatopsis]